MGEAQEADDVDRADPDEEHDRRELQEEPPRIGGESLDMEAARFHRPLRKEGLAVERRKAGTEREKGQHQGA